MSAERMTDDEIAQRRQELGNSLSEDLSPTGLREMRLLNEVCESRIILRDALRETNDPRLRRRICSLLEITDE